MTFPILDRYANWLLWFRLSVNRITGKLIRLDPKLNWVLRWVPLLINIHSIRNTYPRQHGGRHMSLRHLRWWIKTTMIIFMPHVEMPNFLCNTLLLVHITKYCCRYNKSQFINKVKVAQECVCASFVRHLIWHKETNISPKSYRARIENNLDTITAHTWRQIYIWYRLNQTIFE